MAKSKKATGRTRDIVIAIDKRIHWFTRHWLGVFNTLAGLYVGLSILAPILMKIGLTRPAGWLYTIYSYFCHQQASRSFFLFGEQAAYPRAVAGTGFRPIESYLADLPVLGQINPANWLQLQLALGDFVGNEQMGYKVALCQRDLALYGAVLLTGLAFAALRGRYRFKEMPIIAFLLIGVLPIGLDGFSQLFGYFGTPLPGTEMNALQSLFAAVPLRESTPTLRVLTGALFGASFAWLAFTYVNGDMADTGAKLEEKLSRIADS